MASGYRDQLIESLEELIELLDKRTTDVSGTVYISPQQPLGDIVEPLWNIRRSHFKGLKLLALMFEADGALAHLSRVNGWEPEFEAARNKFRPAFEALNRVLYFGSETPVELGDHVRVRDFFRMKTGRVTYLPGVSPQNSELDFGGLFDLGVQFDGGSFLGIRIDRDTLEVKKSVEFLRRDPENVPDMPTDEELREY